MQESVVWPVVPEQVDSDFGVDNHLGDAKDQEAEISGSDGLRRESGTHVDRRDGHGASVAEMLA